MAKLWGGRFTKGTDKAVEDFTSSISFDSRMYKEDVAGSIAHATMLAAQHIISAGATSPYSLYSEDFVTFEEDDVYNQADAAGFINLFGLPLKINALMKEKAGK